MSGDVYGEELGKARRFLVVGNSGAGKTRFAQALASGGGLRHVDLDGFAFEPGTATRRPVADAVRDVEAEIAGASGWVVEGCYADLLQALTPRAEALRFLNPGVEACIRHCRARPHEPHKYATKEAQDANLAFLLDWVRGYPQREGPLGLAAHRRLFDGFAGDKRELSEAADPRTAG